MFTRQTQKSLTSAAPDLHQKQILKNPNLIKKKVHDKSKQASESDRGGKGKEYAGQADADRGRLTSWFLLVPPACLKRSRCCCCCMPITARDVDSQEVSALLADEKQ